MVDSHETPNMYPNLNVSLNDQQHFRLNKFNGIRDYFVAKIKERELLSKIPSKYVASFDYFHESLIVLSVTRGSISIASIATVIGEPVGITSTSFTGILKKLLKTTWSKKKKHDKVVVLARSKLHSKERKISEAVKGNAIGLEHFMTIINEDKKCIELKESIIMITSQRSDTEKIKLIKEGNKIGTN